MFDGVTLGERYQVYGKIGGSSFIDRYDGVDLLLARPVDVIALTPQAASDPDVRDRFQTLGRLAATRSAPHIVDVYDIDVFNGQPFVVTEHLSGETLRAIIDTEAPFHPDDVVALIQQLAPAADNAVTRGAGGAAVSPETVLVDASGVARHSDFLTFGSNPAASRESWTGSWPAQSPPGPVQAIASIAYQLLTGRAPDSEAVRSTPPSVLNAAGTPDMDRIVLRGLDPRLRDHASATAFSAALAAAARRARQVREPPPPRRPPPPAPTPTLVAAPATVEQRPPDSTVEADMANEDEPVRLVPGPGRPRSFPWTAAAILLLSVIVVALIFERFSDARSGHVPATATSAVSQVVVTGPTATAPPVTASQVPPVVGLTRDAAAAKLAEAGLILEESAPVSSDTIATGAVAAQEPPPGSAIPSNRTVRVALSRGPATVDLASLSLPGMAEANARRELEARGLTVTSSETGSATVPAGQVVATQPSGVVKSGSTVTLAVSVGDKLQIPRGIFSMPLKDAEAQLAKAGIKVAGTIKVGPSEIAGRINTSEYKIESGDVVGVQNEPGDASFGGWIARDSAVTLVYYDASS